MNWIVDLFTGTSIAHSILVYALVIACGVILGKMKIFGVSLGTTFVLFVGILLGHLGLTVDALPSAFFQQKSRYGILLRLLCAVHLLLPFPRRVHQGGPGSPRGRHVDQYRSVAQYPTVCADCSMRSQRQFSAVGGLLYCR